MKRWFGWLLTVAGFLVIAAATLVPIPRQEAASRATPVWCLVCGDHGAVDVLNNLLLFIPFGAGLRLMGRPSLYVTAAGALISLVVEFLQLSMIPGRDPSLSDLLTNSTGSWIGATLANYRARILDPAPLLAIRLAALGTITWWMVQFGSAVLLRPWAPSGELRAAWVRAIPGREPFDGRVISAVVSGTSVPPGPVPSDLTQKIRQGLVQLELDFVSGESTRSWSPLFEILGPSSPVLGLQAVGQDLAFEAPARSAGFRLRRPALRLEGALLASPDSPTQLVAGERNDTLWAIWTAGGKKRSSIQVVSPSFGWSLVTPIWYAYGREVRVITGIWLAAWLLPIGYWFARSTRGRHWPSWFLPLVLLVGLGGIPALLEYSPVSWSEWLAGVFGLGVGRAGPRIAAYLQERCDSPSTSGSS